MINLFVTERFERNLAKFLKKHPELEQVIQEKIDLFIADSHSPRLRTHKLSGHLANQWAFSITYSYRITFLIDANDYYLTNIGNHDEVY